MENRDKNASNVTYARNEAHPTAANHRSPYRLIACATRIETATQHPLLSYPHKNTTSPIPWKHITITLIKLTVIIYGRV
jgi:hypothetical protein